MTGRMPFSAKCCGIDFDDRAAFDGHFKAEHRGQSLPGSAIRQDKSPAWRTGYSLSEMRQKPTPLSKVEKEWLGVWVRICEGRIGQVWAVAAKPERHLYVAVSGLGVIWKCNVDELRKLGTAGHVLYVGRCPRHPILNRTLEAVT